MLHSRQSIANPSLLRISTAAQCCAHALVFSARQTDWKLMTAISQLRHRCRRVLLWLVAGSVLAACSGPGTDKPAQTHAPAAAGTLRSVAVVTNSSPADA